MKVLLIEDNRAIAKNIKNYLTLDNWVVEVVFDGVD
jgi:DNA-binding response OmpR family regulator